MVDLPLRPLCGERGKVDSLGQASSPGSAANAATARRRRVKLLRPHEITVDERSLCKTYRRFAAVFVIGNMGLRADEESARSYPRLLHLRLISQMLFDRYLHGDLKNSFVWFCGRVGATTFGWFSNEAHPLEMDGYGASLREAKCEQRPKFQSRRSGCA